MSQVRQRKYPRPILGTSSSWSWPHWVARNSCLPGPPYAHPAILRETSTLKRRWPGAVSRVDRAIASPWRAFVVTIWDTGLRCVQRRVSTWHKSWPQRARRADRHQADSPTHARLTADVSQGSPALTLTDGPVPCKLEPGRLGS